MDIQLTGIVVIVGNYGSGKTEVAVNLAIHQKQKGIDVRIADLDLVNPYFRTREAREILAEFDIDLVLPPAKYMHADLPILTPAVAGMLRAPAPLTILDAGGDDVGATVLAALADVMANREIQMIQVVNPFRPFTETVEGCLTIQREIEEASKLNVTGLIGNANLIDDTGAETIEEGYDFVQKLSKESGLPLKCITVPTHLASQMNLSRFACPVLPISRQLVPPWKRPGNIGRPASLKI